MRITSSVENLRNFAFPLVVHLRSNKQIERLFATLSHLQKETKKVISNSTMSKQMDGLGKHNLVEVVSSFISLKKSEEGIGSGMI